MAGDYSKWRASKDEVEAFHTAPFDWEAARSAMVARITRSMKQLNGEKVPARGGQDFETLHNNGVVYRPTLNDTRVEFFDVDDEDGFHATRSNLLAMLPELAKDVEAGHHDEQLKMAMESEPNPVAPKSTGATGTPRNTGPQAKLNIGVAAKRRANPPPSWADIRKSYIDGGADPAMVDAAIEKRKAAEKA